MQKQTDWEGREIPEDEPDDAIIKVWEVEPHPGNRRCDCFVERSWQNMFKYVADNLDSMLERFDEDELKEGVTVKFRLVTMRKSDYQEIVDAEQ